MIRALQSPRPWWALLLALLAFSPAACGDDEPAANGDYHAEGGEGEEHTEGASDVVRLDSAQLALAAVQVAPAGTGALGALSVTGTVAYDPNRVSHVGARTDGRIVALRANLGDRVGAGQVLAVMENAEVGLLRAELGEAESLLGIAREGYARERRLENLGVSSRKELLEFEAELRRREAAVEGARERLRVLGAAGGRGGRFTVTAPFAGSIVARDASLGEMANPEDTLFTVADLSRLAIELNILERDLGRVQQGQEVEVTTAAYPGRTFAGRIAYLGEVVDPQTRSVPARVEIANPGGALKPGMFATARVLTGGGVQVIAVPRDAVQDLAGRQVVFVPGSRPGEFRPQPVEVGEPVNRTTVSIRSGLQPGQPVVVAGAFALKSELAKGEIGEHGH